MHESAHHSHISSLAHGVSNYVLVLDNVFRNEVLGVCIKPIMLFPRQLIINISCWSKHHNPHNQLLWIKLLYGSNPYKRHLSLFHMKWTQIFKKIAHYSYQGKILLWKPSVVPWGLIKPDNSSLQQLYSVVCESRTWRKERGRQGWNYLDKRDTGINCFSQKIL